MTHHLSDFMKSVMYLRRFCDQFQIPDSMTMTLTFDNASDYARFICSLHKELEANLLGILYRDKFSDPETPWYEEFMLMGVTVKLTYKGKQ